MWVVENSTKTPETLKSSASLGLQNALTTLFALIGLLAIFLFSGNAIG
jgi:hypothetical protein